MDFDIVYNMSDQIGDLGLGQINAPEVVTLDVTLNADVLQEGEGIQEDFFMGVLCSTREWASMEMISMKRSSDKVGGLGSNTDTPLSYLYI